MLDEECCATCDYNDICPGEVLTFLKDEEGRYIAFNSNCEKRFHPIIGARDRDFLSGSLADMFESTDQLALVKDQPIEVVETIHTGEAQPQLWLVQKTPVKLKNKRFISGCAINITHHVKKAAISATMAALLVAPAVALHFSGSHRMHRMKRPGYYITATAA